MRVLNLLRGMCLIWAYSFLSGIQCLNDIYLFIFFKNPAGLSASLNVRIVYLDIMRPFAESTLLGWERDAIYLTLSCQWLHHLYSKNIISLFSLIADFYVFTLVRSLTHGQIPNSQWIFDSPANSDVESKLRNYLLELGSDKILGIQVGVS
jgi:aarF domain-containing kinase